MPLPVHDTDVTTVGRNEQLSALCSEINIDHCSHNIMTPCKISLALIGVSLSEGLAHTQLFHPWACAPEGRGWSGPGVPCPSLWDPVRG